MKIINIVLILAILSSLVLLSCEKPEEIETYLIPGKATGVFRVDFTQIPFYDETSGLGIPVETISLFFKDWFAEMAIEADDIQEIYGFFLPHNGVDSVTPVAGMIVLSEYDPVAFNNFTVRNPDMAEVEYGYHSYWYDENDRIAFYAKSDREILVANEISAMDEILELSFRQPPVAPNTELAEFLRKNKNQLVAVKSKLHGTIPEDLWMIRDFKAVSFTLDVGISLDAVIEIDTSSADTAEGIAALIEGASRTTYGLLKLGMAFPGRFEEQYMAFTPDVKEAFVTMNEIIGTLEARARDSRVTITMAPKLDSVIKMLEYGSVIEEFIYAQ